MFSCAICEIYKNTFFYRTPLVAVSSLRGAVLCNTSSTSVNVTNTEFSADLVTFTEKILHGKFQFLCSEENIKQNQCVDFCLLEIFFFIRSYEFYRRLCDCRTYGMRQFFHPTSYFLSVNHQFFACSLDYVKIHLQ